MKINITYDASTASAPAGFFTAVNAAVQFFDQEFSTPITINLHVGWGEVDGQVLGAGDLGESVTTYVLSEPGTGPVVNGDWTTPAAIVLAPPIFPQFVNLPVTPQYSYLPFAEARILENAPSDPSIPDGYIGLSSTADFTFDPNNRAVAGAYDAIGVIEHEISEILGRSTQDFKPPPGFPELLNVLDLWRYASPGVLDGTPGSPGFFSLNGDQLLAAFNDQSNGGDAGDWAASTPGDAFDAFAQPGVMLAFSAVDLRVMETLGYYVSPTAPTPNGIPTTPITFSQNYTIAQGQTLSFDGPAAIFVVPGVVVAPAGVNAGSIVDNGQDSQVDVVGVAYAPAQGIIGGPNLNFTNTSTGHLTVTATAVAGDAVAIFEGFNVVNSGTISATSDQADAWGVVSPYAGTSTGVLTVQALDHAIGVLVEGDVAGGAAFSNAGTITVTGLHAIGVQGATSFNNSGTIHAIGAGANSTSIAVYATPPFGTTYTNSGLIEGEYAFLIDTYTGGGFSNTTINNSGMMMGIIGFGNANNVVNNTGHIIGAIDFGVGNSTYNGATGTQTGGIFLGQGDNVVTLGADGEVVFGGGVDDTITGGSGNDFIELYRGSNTIDAGGGFNALSLADSDVGYTVNLGAGTATANVAAAGSDKIKNIQEVIGSNFNNTLIAGSTAATLIAGSGHDTLIGGAGADNLVAGAGGDLMTGGAGNDVFIYSAGDHQLVITDFGAGGDHDVLHIDGYASAQSVVQQGANTLITLSNSDTILLDNVLASSLTSSNVVYNATPFHPPAVPTSPPVFGTVTIDLGDNLTVGAGETLHEANQSVGILDLGLASNTDAGVDNFGVIDVSQSSGGVVGFEAQSGGNAISAPGFKNEKGATFAVSDIDPHGSATGYDDQAGLPISNAGLFTVSSIGAAVGFDVDALILTGQILNVAGGVIDVTSSAAAATGLILNDGFGGGGSQPPGAVNAGAINVSGAGTATGIEVDQDKNGGFTNDGSITAVASGVGAHSFGVTIKGFAADAGGGAIQFVNAGAITADTAILMSNYDGFPDLALTNSGKITGTVDLSTSQAVNDIVNTGAIVGAIRFGDGNDTYNGVGGTHAGGIYLGHGVNTVTLGAEGEFVFGGGGSDAITGGAGNDFIEIGRGTNTIDGGGGFNRLSLADSDEGVIVNLATGTVTGAGVSTVKNIQEVIGSNFNDTMIAGATAVTFVAGAGKDTLIGGAGGDTLVAGAGKDTMTGGGGNNTFVYAAGDHQLVITDFGAVGDSNALDIYGYASAQSIQQQGANTLITLSSGDSILLENVQAGSLTGANLVFHTGGYTQPPVPASPPVYFSSMAPFLVDDGLTIFQGEQVSVVAKISDLNVNQNIGIFENSTLGVTAAHFQNQGHVAITSADAGLFALLDQPHLGTSSFSNSFGATFDVKDTAPVAPPATELGGAEGVNLEILGSSFSNGGEFSVTAVGAADGVEMGAPGASVTNAVTGKVTVVSSAAQAVGFAFDGFASVENDGTIDVTGVGTAFGLQAKPGPLSGEGFADGVITNTGTITVQATGVNAVSYGIDVCAAYNEQQPSLITNSGVITADIAILNEDRGPGEGFVPLVVTNTSTGRINGEIDLGGSKSQLNNSGVINGEILFSTVTLSQANDSLFGIFPPAIDNSGAIVGDIVLAGSSATVTSPGSITGDIRLSDGSDIIDLRGGTLTGAIDIAPTLAGNPTNDPIYTPAAGAMINIASGDANLNVTLHGTVGGDTIVRFDVAWAQAKLTHNADGSWTVNAGPDGSLTLTGVQTLQFTDRWVTLATELRDNFKGDAKSDFLIENTSGAVVLGEVSNGAAAYAAAGHLAPAWTFEGNGDLLGLGRDQFLVENTAGAVMVGEMQNGAAVYTTVANLSPAWKFEGVGDFLGAGHDQFLIQNTTGGVMVGEVQGGATVYKAVAYLGSAWKFEGVGAFLGDGKTDFLIENTNGTVTVGDLQNGAAVYTAVAHLGPEWKFKGVGDFLGDSKDDFLIENTAGAVLIGEVANGQTSYTHITTLGGEWRFVGVGDYLGEGHDQFLIENTSGAVDVGDWAGGAIHFTHVAGLGGEWSFH